MKQLGDVKYECPKGRGGAAMKSRWTVTNVYGIRGESKHRTPEAALKAAKKREGEGWIVIDEAGNQWGRNWAGEPVIVREARQ